MKLRNLGVLAAFFLSASAHSADVVFSFLDDSSAFSFGRPHAGVTVTGILYGLGNDGDNQMPTSIKFTSNVSSFGITDILINAAENNFILNGGGGFSLAGGVITGGGFSLNFDDPLSGGKQLRLNSPEYKMNLLMWNGGSGPYVASGNTNAFAGASYSTISAVPEPEAYAMMLAGLGLLGFMAKRKKTV